MRQVIIDVETTGLKPEEGHRVVEFAALELIDLEQGDHMHTYLNPHMEVPEGAFKVHGLCWDFLQDFPDMTDVDGAIKQFVGDSEIIAHNAPFDRGFLEAEGVTFPGDWFCTYELAKEWYGGKRWNLDRLAKIIGVAKSRRRIHGALKDCMLTGDVLIAMMDARAKFIGERARREEILRKVRLPMPPRGTGS